MKCWLVLRLALFGLMATLAACNYSQVEVQVNFAQPFPATAPDLPGFLPRDCKQYSVQSGDSTERLIIGEKLLIRSHVLSAKLSGARLDSMGMSHQPGRHQGRDGLPYRVQALKADSFQVWSAMYDTLLNLNRRPMPRLRYYRGRYYVSRPIDSITWDVSRIRVSKGQAFSEAFNPDSLRIQALDPAVVRRQRTAHRLVYTLVPQSRQAIRQVSTYDGLWVSEIEYAVSILAD